jgi:hypothetical protein
LENEVQNLTSVKILIVEKPYNYRRQMDNTGTRSGKSYKEFDICIITWSALSVFWSWNVMTNRDRRELYRDLDIVADIENKKLEWIVKIDHGRAVKKHLRGNRGKKKNGKT